MLVVALGACNKDDDDANNNCTQADWVGNYTGTQVCNGVPFDISVTITASGEDAVIVKYDDGVSEASFDPITIDGCKLNRTQEDPSIGASLTIEATLDGDNLSFRDVLTVGTDTSDCTITATRN